LQPVITISPARCLPFIQLIGGKFLEIPLRHLETIIGLINHSSYADSDNLHK
jgi:hypothetical protein